MIISIQRGQSSACLTSITTLLIWYLLVQAGVHIHSTVPTHEIVHIAHTEVQECHRMSFMNMQQKLQRTKDICPIPHFMRNSVLENCVYSI